MRECVYVCTCVHASVFVLRPFNRKCVLEKVDSCRLPLPQHLNKLHDCRIMLGSSIRGRALGSEETFTGRQSPNAVNYKRNTLQGILSALPWFSTRLAQ